MTNINVERILLDIRVACKSRGEKIVSSSLFNAEQIKDVLWRAAQATVISGEISVDKWEINLGVIPAAQFDTLFLPRLVQAFAERLARDQALMAGHHAVKMSTSEATESDVLHGKATTDDEALFRQALCCLMPSIQTAELANKTASQLQQLLQLLLKHTWRQQEVLPACWFERVTDSRLSIAAALYLLNSQQGRDWLSQRAPVATQVTAWAAAVAQGDIPPEQVMLLLTGNRSSGSTVPGQPAFPPWIVTRWLLPLWRQPAVRQVIRRHKGGHGVQQIDAYLSGCVQRQDNAALREEKGGHTDPIQAVLARDNVTLPANEAMPVTSRRRMQQRGGYSRGAHESGSSGQGVSNAGVLLLWPLLPQLFSLPGLWADTQFISDTARWQAVLCLDRLVWGETDSPAERLTLNRLLCGIALSTPVPENTPLSMLQQQQTDDWLTAIGQQLTGWQKLSLTDIRQLFLQRPGDIHLDGACPRIIVQAEPYDFLLRDWPWPMTLASFPWAEQPLTIVWPLTGLTG
ncbi:contractile injection system tape measure protein [Enterobacter ludwigii]|uniref:contractile injection system tape measure protein n=1 Tax=Enterobacter ludwigii TaxID=299767 RepID=UPI003F6E6FA5